MCHFMNAQVHLYNKKKKALWKVLLADYVFFPIPLTVLSCQTSFMLFLISFQFRTHNRSWKSIYIANFAAFPAPFSVSFQRLLLNFLPYPYSHFLIQNLERQNIPAKELMALYPVVIYFCSPSSAVLCYKIKLLPTPSLACSEREGRQSDSEEGFLEITAQ